ncbi:MAG: TolC family outer membrane protein [Panacagrimonas sp.]
MGNKPRLRLPVLLGFGLALSAIQAQAMTLGEALAMAAERDPAVAASRAAYSAESELGEQERSLLRPSVELEGRGDYAYSDSQFSFGAGAETYPAWSAYLRARQALLRFDWSARGDRADVRDGLAEEGKSDRLRQFIARVCQRYLDTLLAEDGLDQAESEARAVRESLDDTRKRYEVELVPGTDLKEAQARNDLAQAQLISARADLEDQRDGLHEVTGYDRAPLPRLGEQLEYPPLDPPDMEGWVKLAVADGTATRTARLRVQLATADLASRRAEALPRVDVVAEGGRFDSTAYSQGQLQDDVRVGLELTVPIYAGGYNGSRVREAEARLSEAEAELQRIVLESEREVRTVFRSVETARAEETAFERAMTSATAAEVASRAGYDAGSRTITDVLDAKSRVVEARRNRNASRYTLLIRLLTLNAISGTLTVERVQALDRLFESR